MAQKKALQRVRFPSSRSATWAHDPACPTVLRVRADRDALGSLWQPICTMMTWYRASGFWSKALPCSVDDSPLEKQIWACSWALAETDVKCEPPSCHVNRAAHHEAGASDPPGRRAGRAHTASSSDGSGRWTCALTQAPKAQVSDMKKWPIPATLSSLSQPTF